MFSIRVFADKNVSVFRPFSMTSGNSFSSPSGDIDYYIFKEEILTIMKIIL